MLNLQEHIELNQVNEAWYTEFDHETIDQAEHYSLVYNPYTLRTVVRLLNDKYESLGEVEFKSSELAIAFVEEYFDIDDDDVDWMHSYDWVDDARDEVVFNEALDSIEEFIQKAADEYKIRIDHINPDAQFDGQFGIAVHFNRNNNRNDLDKFIKNTSSDLLRTYGVQSYNFDGAVWELAL